MKREAILLYIVSLCIHSNAQPYYINFAGDGLSSVKVENLTSGLIINLGAGDVLRLSTTTGIHEDNNMISSGLRIFPNPMTVKSTLEILPPIAGNAKISICDISGKVLTQFKGYLENNTYAFSLSGLKDGLYIINVHGNGYQFSKKLISKGKTNGKITVEWLRKNIEADVENKSIKDFKGTLGTVDMVYKAGERIKYTGLSGNNRTVIIDIPTNDEAITFVFTECKDGSDNNYPIVQIGTQLWMAENLKTTKYSNSTDIPFVNTTNAWDILIETDKAFCYFLDNIINANIYGAIYTWPAAMNGMDGSNSSPSGVQGACPVGWHLPSVDEWTTLINNLGGSSVAGEKLKETGVSHWGSLNTGATNESGFTALPGGFRDDWGWQGINIFGGWWTSSADLPLTAWTRWVDASTDVVSNMSANRKYGFSVRCLKD